jgi:hypothetical protein
LPEQLDIADELGLMVYSEHDTAWLQDKDTKFGVSLNDVVRRDRNHPCLVLWGLLNETPAGPFYDAAKGWLPSLRAIDDTRLVLLSSGRWDRDLRTGSAANPGSATWNIYLGGEDPENPKTEDAVVKPFNSGYISGVGDAHIYQRYPTTWEFVETFAGWARDSKPVFLSESGLGSSFNIMGADRKLRAADAPVSTMLWRWNEPGVEGVRRMWAKYHLETLYPDPEEMFIDSQRNAARQRELMFNIVRSNPRVIGYSLTSFLDCDGNGEGIADGFREVKAGHEPVFQAGWAPLRWCLFVNPMHVYADRPFHIKAALASEDALPAGTYPVTLRIRNASTMLWEHKTTVTIPAGPQPPMAYDVFADDINVQGLHEGQYTLTASFDQRENAAAAELPFFVSERALQPNNIGPVTVLNVPQSVTDMLTAHGATIRQFDVSPDQQIDHEVILIGELKSMDADLWRAIYSRAARGAHVVFLVPKTFRGDDRTTRWLALPAQGGRTGDNDWLYHKDVLAKVHPATAGLQTKIMTPDYYGELLRDTEYFYDMTPPDDAIIVAIRATDDPLKFGEGVMLGVYNHHAGKFTVNALQIVPRIGDPAADRLLLNLVVHARSTAAAVHPLPENYATEIDSLLMVK